MRTWCKFSLFILPLLLMPLLYGCDTSPVDGGDGVIPGSRFTVYTDANGLANNFINDIAVDYFRAGIWIATQKGVSFFSFGDSTFTSFGSASGLPNLRVNAVELNLGVPWVGTESGPASFSDADSLWHELSNPQVFPSTFITTLASMPDPDLSLWFGTPAGAVRRSPLGVFTTFTTNDGLTSNEITSIARDSAGNVWVGTQFGLNSFNGTNWTTYTTTLPSTQVQTVFVDSFGNIWTGTSDGIEEFTGNRRVRFGTFDGLPSPSVNAFTEDFTRMLWAGTSQGVASFDGTVWTRLKLPDAVNGLSVTALASDAITRSIWIGTTNGLVRYQPAIQ